MKTLGPPARISSTASCWPALRRIPRVGVIINEVEGRKEGKGERKEKREREGEREEEEGFLEEKILCSVTVVARSVTERLLEF